MQTRSSSRLIRDQYSNPTSSTNTNPEGRNRRGSKQRVENFNLEEHFPPVVTMADQRTMAELLRAPTEGAARRWLEKEPSHSITTWEDLVSKFINEFFSPSRTTNLCNEISNFQQRFDESFHEAWDRYKDLLCGNLLERSTQDVLTIIENKYKQTSAVTTVMTAMLKQFQATPPPAPVKAVEETCVTCKAMQTQIDMVKNELRNEMKNSIQTFLFIQTNEIKNMMASLLQMNTASTSGSGSLPSNTVANPKGELKAITTRSGLVIDGPTVPTPPQSINPEVDERVEETFTDPDLAEYTIKVPHPPVKNTSLHIKENLLCIKGILFIQISLIPQGCSNKNNKKKMKSKSKIFGKCSNNFISTSLLLML
uniref:Retrotransposon gag domain-containing protein n=1 Tax=Tanacetum cinerariifolium TaxID=118510 RepID=A0A6L2MN56_TANCI|nr:hypothetical protein [Tanacetum cinerariifolium]